MRYYTIDPIFRTKKTSLFRQGKAMSFWWRWRDSNPRPKDSILGYPTSVADCFCHLKQYSQRNLFQTIRSSPKALFRLKRGSSNGTPAL